MVNLIDFGSGQLLILGFIEFAIMGIVDGLVLKRVHLGEGPFEAGVVTGIWAQVIGVLSLLLLVFMLMFIPTLLSQLATYCHSNVTCEMITPIISMFAAWPIFIGYVIVIPSFILWCITRKKDINIQPIGPIWKAQSGKQIRTQIHERIDQEQKPQISDERINEIRRDVDGILPYIMLQRRKLVMEKREVNTAKLIQVIMADATFRKMNPSEQIAVRVAIEAFTSAVNKNGSKNNRNDEQIRDEKQR